MGESAGNCKTAFLLAADLQPHEAAWRDWEGYAQRAAAASAPLLGFMPQVRAAALDETLYQSLAAIATEDFAEILVLPVAQDLNLLEREMLGRVLAEARRAHPAIAIHHDDIDPGDPLLVEFFAARLGQTLEQHGLIAQRTGLILAASGKGDAASRAQSYRFLRLLWERAGLAAGEIGFVRHEQPFLLRTFERCAKYNLPWIVVPHMLWKSEYFCYAEVILENFRKDHAPAAGWPMAAPPKDNPGMTAWLARRMTQLWRDKRRRELARQASPKRAAPPPASTYVVGSGTIAAVTSKSEMAKLLHDLWGGQHHGRVFIKVTWHGYATGTYTDPAALDLLLGALPTPAVVLEGHTSSRNLGGAAFDWETQARENRAWIRQQEAEYLRRTGLAEVLARHSAQYVNITESYWDDACVRPEDVCRVLEQRGVKLLYPQLAHFIPQILWEHAGCPLISFAKFKGATRLTISNMFGLLPEPLRAAWHGPNITYMARVCCDLIKLYGVLFPLFGIAEALYTAIRWDRRGLYRSRWGNYDLIENAGYVTASRGLVTADILASRLQGQDVNRSAFFDVVRSELGWDEAAANAPLPLTVLAS